MKPIIRALRVRFDIKKTAQYDLAASHLYPLALEHAVRSLDNRVTDQSR
jgi:hypothetical protein